MSARKKTDSVKAVKRFMKRVQALPGRRPLYRGLAGADWDVESAAFRRVRPSDETQGLHRDAASVKHRRNRFSDGTRDLHQVFKNYSVQLLETASMRGLRAHAGGEFSDLALLAQLQHYGAATCLIDFTYNPLVALWFACREESKKGGKVQDGKVVVMDIQAGAVAIDPSESTKPEEEFQSVKMEQLQDPIEKFLDGKTLWTWEPLPRENRVIAQQSIFVFGKPIIEDRYYEEIRVLSSAKAGIISALRDKFGVSEESLFGDFAGFALANAHGKRYTEYSEEDYYNFANWFRRNRQHEKAIEYCNQVLEKNRKHAGAYHLRGRCNVFLNNKPNAIADFSQAITFDPTNISAIFFRASLYARILPERHNAVADYTKMIELESDNKHKVRTWILVLAYHRRGRVQAQLGKHPDAIEDFTSAIALDPENATIYLDRAKSHRALGNESAAQADEKKAAELDPKLRKSNSTQNTLL